MVLHVLRSSHRSSDAGRSSLHHRGALRHPVQEHLEPGSDPCQALSPHLFPFVWSGLSWAKVKIRSVSLQDRASLRSLDRTSHSSFPISFFTRGVIRPNSVPDWSRPLRRCPPRHLLLEHVPWQLLPIFSGQCYLRSSYYLGFHGCIE